MMVLFLYLTNLLSSIRTIQGTGVVADFEFGMKLPLLLLCLHGDAAQDICQPVRNFLFIRLHNSQMPDP
jgi:hypothetical protein